MQVGDKIRRKKDGREGTITAVTDKEIIVQYTATGETQQSPWGEYKDAGQEGHIFSQFADRLIEVL